MKQVLLYASAFLLGMAIMGFFSSANQKRNEELIRSSVAIPIVARTEGELRIAREQDKQLFEVWFLRGNKLVPADSPEATGGL